MEGEGLAAKLAMSQVWLSLTVEGDPLPSNGGEPLTDWRIVVAPPLVLQNQLPVRGSFLVWEEPRVRPPAVSKLQEALLSHANSLCQHLLEATDTHCSMQNAQGRRFLWPTDPRCGQ